MPVARECGLCGWLANAKATFNLGGLPRVAAFAVGEFSQAMKWRRGVSRTDTLDEVVFRVIFLAGILMLPLAQALASDLRLLLRWWSFATLGKYFTTVVKTSADQVVVERGPSGVLRHPSYTGLLAAFVGAGLMFGNWVGTAASFLLILVGLIFRLLREERAMIGTRGDAYGDFAKDRARLVPFVL